MQACLLLHEEHFPIVVLGINEIVYVLYEIHVGQLFCELLNVSRETKSDDR